MTQKNRPEIIPLPQRGRTVVSGLFCWLFLFRIDEPFRLDIVEYIL